MALDGKIDLHDVVLVPIKSLKKDSSNPNVMNERQMNGLRASMKRFGYLTPIIVDKNTMVIADGEHRATIYEESGRTEVPCILLDLKDDAERRLLRQTMNKLRGQHDKEKDLTEIDFLIRASRLNELALLTGVGNQGLLASLQKVRDKKELKEPISYQSRVKYGQIWELGNHRLMCGDSTVDSDVAFLFDHSVAQFCFTSPPYTDQRDYGGGLNLNPIHLADFLKAPCELFAVNLGIVMKNNEVSQYWDYYISRAKSLGLKLLSWNVWSKQGFGYTVGQATAMFPIEHEFIFIFGSKIKLNRTIPNKLARTFKSGTIREKDGSTKGVYSSTGDFRPLGTVIRTDVQRYTTKESNPHPAMFPVELVKQYIFACTDENTIVYDPFGGAGSTLLACEQTNRVNYSMELLPNYCDIILERWETQTGRKAELVH